MLRAMSPGRDLRVAAWVFVSLMSTTGCVGRIGGGSGPDATPGGGEPGEVDAAPPLPPSDGPITPTFTVALTPQTGIAGVQRLNFAVPLSSNRIADPSLIRIGLGSSRADLRVARRVLATYPNGSPRSVQIQVDVDVSAETTLGVEIGRASLLEPLALMPVAGTLVSDAAGPKVWVALPAAWLSDSGVVGPMRAQAEFAGSALDAWALCDYAEFDSDVFLAEQADKGSWLYDRPTALFRGYAMTGAVAPLRSAWREVGIYREGVPISGGAATSIPVPESAGDLKYHYAQGMAIHYLLTGDDRFREAAEAVAERVHTLWDPDYDGSENDFWTERHAGFSLLAYEWAAMVSDDRAATFAGYAAAHVDAYLALQARYPVGYDDGDARCFAHHASAHDEPYGYFGCSPWMSAILADGLDAHVRRVGGTRAADVKASIVKLGRIVARDGRDGDGRPYYWMGVGTPDDLADEFEEHWGESAYVVAMAWHHGGRTDAALRGTADELIAGLRSRGEAGQLRSFNWQCRSAIATPYFLE